MIEKLASAPPDKMLIKLSSCGVLELVNRLFRTCLSVSGSASGTGICAIIRNTNKMPSTAKMRLRISLWDSDLAIIFQFMISVSTLFLHSVYTTARFL